MPIAAQQPGATRPPVSDEDKKLAADWLRRIEAALARPSIKDSFKTFERNRKLLRGIDPDSGAKMRSNLHFANLASMRPQVYAKDPEFALTPTRAVPEQRLPAIRMFAEAGETVLHQVLVRDAKLKRRAKRLLTAAYATSVGWWKCSWQEPPAQTQPLIANAIKDGTDNAELLAAQQEGIANPGPGQDPELLKAQATQTQAGMQSQSEVAVGRGATLDFVLSEDILILDASVLELGDYLRSNAIAHRVYMTREQYRLAMGYACERGKGYVEQSGGSKAAQSGTGGEKKDELLCVWEVWDQSSNRVLVVCDGEEGFCKPPFTPDWTGKRWYPFFGLAFNEIDGTFYPLSDVELTEKVVAEYNESRNDLVKDRKDARPFTVVRKGGSLTPDDVERIRNRDGNDIITVEGVSGKPVSDDLQEVNLGNIDPKVYDTQPARADMEMILGGGDAQRGSVTEAKTATEAKILSQGMHGRSDERRDTLEDLLSELGGYVLEMCLRKFTPEDVRRIVGEELEQAWPTMDLEQIFSLVVVEVRGGSTGKPDQMLEQEQWTKLLPVIQKTVEQVAELYAKGQMKLAQALIELLRETLRRFDERLDIDQFLPPAPEAGKTDPEMAVQELAMLKQQFQECQQALKEAQDKLAKNYISAAATVATSANPSGAVAALPQALAALEGGQVPQPMQVDDPRVPELNATVQALQAQLQQALDEREKALAKIDSDAQVAVQVGTHKANVDAAANVQIQQHKADADRMAAEAVAGAQSEHAAALAPISEGLQHLHDGMQAIGQHLAAPKPRMKVVHERDPATRALVSRLVPDEPQTAMPAPTGEE